MVSGGKKNQTSFIFICDILSNDFFSVWIIFLPCSMLWGFFGVCVYMWLPDGYVRNLLVSGM